MMMFTSLLVKKKKKSERELNWPPKQLCDTQTFSIKMGESTAGTVIINDTPQDSFLDLSAHNSVGLGRTD